MSKEMYLKTWVDAAYGVHSDMRGHTGGLMSVGTGIIHHKTSKQRINTKSSTETEVVGASDYLSYTIWTKKFLEDQGYKLKRTEYYQDNQSAIKMLANGWRSKGDKSRHIDIRYFFGVFVDLGEQIFPLIHFFRKITDFVVQVSHQKISL